MIKVKICGVTDPHDATLAALAGADYIGVIFSQLSKRAVSLSQAAEIYSAIASTTMEMVGVFVNASEQEIFDVCEPLKISTIQLHGHYSSDKLLVLSAFKNIFYAVPPNYSMPHCSKKIMPLIDNNQPGSGQTFDWSVFSPPSRPWILAGGLNSENVATAIRTLKPDMVDVASGVESHSSVRKDADKMYAFIAAAKQREVLC